MHNEQSQIYFFVKRIMRIFVSSGNVIFTEMQQGRIHILKRETSKYETY